MSALLQTTNFHPRWQPVNEQDALHAIARVAARAREPWGAFESIAETALRLPGLHGMQAQLETETLDWPSPQSAKPRGSATAPIVANGLNWGRLRIFFEPRIDSVECPLRFARFVGQQAAQMLNRLRLTNEQQVYLSRITRLAERLETRKSVQRASGLVAESRGISQQAALALLLRYSRQQRRAPKQIAQAIILGDAANSRRFERFPSHVG